MKYKLLGKSCLKVSELALDARPRNGHTVSLIIANA